MWFCCQIWHCNFKTCLGPLEIWKTWNGWSHVVYPSKGNSTSKTFSQSRTRIGRRSSVFYQHRVEELTDSAETPAVSMAVDVAVEVHAEALSPGSSDDSSVQHSSSCGEGLVSDVPSAHLSDMESSLEYWQHVYEENSEKYSNVRCDDTRSLEQCQYRQLWNLRATLEQNECLSDLEDRNCFSSQGAGCSSVVRSDESFDTMDLEGLEQAGSSERGQMHRLEQYRTDSGYCSMSFSETSARSMQTVDSDYDSLDMDSGIKFGDILECEDDMLMGMSSPTDTTRIWDRCQRKNDRSASRKRREFGVGGNRHALARDYSVDKKSDALFREFSRCDPIKTRHRQLTQSYDVQATDRTEIPVITLDVIPNDNV